MQKLSSIVFLFFISAGYFLGQNSPHGNIQFDCEDCHSSSSWKISARTTKFNHSTTGFELIGQHKQVDCKQCHSNLKFEQVRKDCFTCHKDIHKNSVGQDCEKCHTPQSWLIRNVNELHQKSRFPLLGQHASADCKQCHNLYNDLNFEPLGVKCYDCHKSNYLSTQNPNHTTAGFSTSCEDCHNFVDKRWGFASFGHDFFPLEGGHKISNCFDCHQQSSFKGLTQDCYTCHQKDFESTTEPNHVTSQFSQDCKTCHKISAWKPASFDHSKTKFQITGAHVNADCADCHKSGYVNTPTDCYSCHKSNYDQTSNPNHSSVGFQTTCEDCHTTKAWKPASFDHDTKFFPIYSGEHKGEWNNCNTCHTNQANYADFSCINCHEHNQSEMNSEHRGVNGYIYDSKACYNCHPQGKKEGGFNHSSTQFPLIGKHTNVFCSDCHVNNTYANTSMLCESCHTNIFTQSQNPNHIQVGLSTDCKKCHNENGWTPSSFNHANSNFQLLGVHATTNCADCHKGQTTGTSQICNDCHNTNFVNSQNPNHTQVGLSTDCKVCHNSTAWTPSSFNHAISNFQLLGVHATTNCADCHKGQTTGTSQICNDCHNTNFVNSQNPNHTQVGLSTDCKVCHNSTAWIPSTFSHSSTTFLLTGAHINADCSNCHKGQTTGTTFECYACHKTDFDNSVNPNHISGNFPTTCEVCHTTQPGWKPATFQNHDQFFVIQGAHAAFKNDCQKCHANGYTNTPNTCFGCHESNFNATTNPNHKTANFPVDCESCHTQNAWKPATFDHDGRYFPIYSGEHRGEWNTCADCHTNSNDYKVFSCINCHEHNNKIEVDDDHKDVNGYSYVSSECYRCHPNGKDDGFSIIKLKRIER